MYSIPLLLTSFLFLSIIVLNLCFILYHTDSEFQQHNNCLYFYGRPFIKTNSILENKLIQLIPFCIRSNELLIVEDDKDQQIIRGVQYTFEELRRLNVTGKDLLDWFIPIDLIDKYEIYLEFNLIHMTPLFVYNCTKPWFGTLCQFTFNSNSSSFNDIIKTRFGKHSYEAACYTNMKCNHSVNFCLDWREICDGKCITL
ncbi:unnamed protein product [Didymodactylos carnosus]|uniref:Uncharacterized protein n=1 Tax=Didymodactylos carnosus TaxID=1234261 RepID=A0A8S2U7V4_9BILA|nr:unnamed protein product [Didymodactylos carnosus]CAF4328663.1 unnamed protein product [Didymodactylos carnosus]